MEGAKLPTLFNFADGVQNTGTADPDGGACPGHLPPFKKMYESFHGHDEWNLENIRIELILMHSAGCPLFSPSLGSTTAIW
jgi:hypothetical protein